MDAARRKGRQSPFSHAQGAPRVRKIQHCERGWRRRRGRRPRRSLEKVNKAIDEATFGTITLSCGRLTTGVSVPQWMGVLMLAGSFNTAASSYMQTILPCANALFGQWPCEGGLLRVRFCPRPHPASAGHSAARIGQGRKNHRKSATGVGDFLNFCPVHWFWKAAS